MIKIHTIPVPKGWSIERAWEAISRSDQLPAPHSWSTVAVRDGKLVKVIK